MKNTYTDHAANEKWLNELNKDGVVLVYKAIDTDRGAMYERAILGGRIFDSIFEFGSTYEEALSNARAKWNADYQ